MEGAKSISVWNWAPVPENMKDFAHHRSADRLLSDYVCSIRGWDDRGTPQTKEFGDFARAIKPLGGLIGRLSKVDMSSGNAGAARSSRSGKDKMDGVFKVKGDEIVWRVFRIPGYEGRVVIAVNMEVGTWCDGRSPTDILPDETFRIDDRGELAGYTPFREPRLVSCRVSLPNMKCYDLVSGKKVDLDGGGSFRAPFMPGGGRVFFICSDSSSEVAEIKREFSLP